MASATQHFPRISRMLRENSSAKEKREALTYIRSNAKKLESSGGIKEEQYKELCRMVVEASTNKNHEVQHEAYDTLTCILQEFKNHRLNLFEAMFQISRKDRLKIVKVLEVVEDNAVLTAADDPSTLRLLHDCMHTVQPAIMEWLSTTACIDNLQMLTEAENRLLSDEQKFEEEMINYSLNLMRKLYKVSALITDDKIRRFDTMLVDKVVPLAYMGHKRQRGAALKVLQQAVLTNSAANLRLKHSDLWTQYKTALQTTYCKRMSLLVTACDLDWATQWNISIQFLGTDLHRGASLINNLLSVEEKAFKSTDTIIRRQAFLSWKLLVDNFALDPHELATARRIKLLCIPLNAKNSKTELIALTKLEVWWHLIIKLYKNITEFVNPVITQFLNFCFGPLGDTPLLSSKFNVAASPGKRFFKTKIVAVDALCQLLVAKQENHSLYTPILEELVPHSISNSVFQECYKSIVHSVGEALLILSQLTDKEMQNRYQLGKLLWTSLINYAQETKEEIMDLVHKEILSVIIELGNHTGDKTMIKDLILDVIVFELPSISKDFDIDSQILTDLLLKLVSAEVLHDMKKDHCEALKCLLGQCIKSRTGVYNSNTMRVLRTVLEKVAPLEPVNENMSVVIDMWSIIADLLITYMEDSQDINEGNSTLHNFESMHYILKFPFLYVCWKDAKQVQEISKIWRKLYKLFDLQADLIETVKSNEVLTSTTNMIRNCINENDDCRDFAVACLDVLSNSINYNALFANCEIPSILHLLTELAKFTFTDLQFSECEIVLKVLSAMLITVYGHNLQKTILYLQYVKPLVELLLTTKMTTLPKEVVNMWETVIIIFKGLGVSRCHEILPPYKEIVILALNHANEEIVLQTMTFFEELNNLEDKMKNLIDEIQKKMNCNKLASKLNKIKRRPEHVEKIGKQIKVVGTVLSKKSESPKSLLVTLKDKDEKKKVSLADPDSQEYVLIKSEVAFDVNRLTEHQKEMLLKRREDIPAMYNDLSQSSSQNSQNLQEWFDKKVKRMCESESKQDIKKTNPTAKENVDHDANKENKIDSVEHNSVDKVSNDLKSIQQSTSAQIAQSTKPIEKQEEPVDGDKMDKLNSENDDSSQIETKTNVRSSLDNAALDKSMEIEDDTEEDDQMNSAAKRLDFESHEEFPENNESKDSSSIANKTKQLRDRPSRVSPVIINDEASTSSSSSEPSTSKVAKTLKTKPNQNNNNLTKEKDTDHDDAETKEKSLEEAKKGAKRKHTSDSESEENAQQPKQKKLMSNQASKNIESENAPTSSSSAEEGENLSKRTQKEIHRLKINMVFDTQLSNRRRSKQQEELKDSSEKSEGKGIRLRSTPKVGEKEIKCYSSQAALRKRGRKTKTSDTEKSDEPQTSDSSKKTTGEESELETSKSSSTEDSIVPSSAVDSGINNSTSISDNKNESPDRETSTQVNEVKKDVKENRTDDEEDSESDTSIKLVKNSAPQDEEGESSPLDDLSAEIVLSSQNSDVNPNPDNNSENLLDKLNKVKQIQDTDKSSELSDSKDILETSSITIKTEIKVEEIEQSNCIKEEPMECVENGEEQTEEQTVENCEIQQQVNTSPAMKQAITTSNFSSPKGSVKRSLRFKSFTSQGGRAAHMLGLVTKQALIDNNGTKVEEDSTAKKTKQKEAESGETQQTEKKEKKTTGTSKDNERIATPCSSRQEKIFSNMRLVEYRSSSPIGSFFNLKNDGEKISSRVDKLASDHTSTRAENNNEKGGVDGSESPCSSEIELPVLGWTSANPPSLSASPSASILKRHRLAISEPELDTATPTKRKRVSFADPPVSKEMSYEIAMIDSPSKTNKLSSRTFMFRKDSPARPKQTKLKLVEIDSSKLTKEVEEQTDNTCEVDLQCERENELLTKIAEELEYSENMVIEVEDVPTFSDGTSDIAEKNGNTAITIDNLTREVEIIAPVVSKNAQSQLTKKNKEKENEIQESETQQDMFSTPEDKTDINTSIIEQHDSSNDQQFNKNNSLDFIKPNVTNDSVIKALSKEKSDSGNLEDTLDIENITSLNSTATSDDTFCGKPLRTSTQTAMEIAEQDTLPVTDSVFGSLRGSQESEYVAHISQPELLNDTQPICPDLTSCEESINSLVDYLTNPLWVKNLKSCFSSRGLHTVGDLAQLSEREINRIPVKGSPKVEFVKKVLQHFKSTKCAQVDEAKTAEQSPNVTQNELSNCSPSIVQATGSTTTPVSSKTDICTITSTSESVAPKNGSSTPIATSREAQPSNSTSMSFVPGNLQGQPTEMSSTSSTITSCLDFSTSTINQISVRPVSSSKVAFSQDKSPSGSSSSITDTPEQKEIVRSTRSVGICTDFVGFSEITSKKVTKSTDAQITLEDLLEELDANLVLQSAIRRSCPEKIISQYKVKLRHLSEAELERDTLKYLGVEKHNYNELNLKAVCRACGVNKVLLRLPDIFNYDKEFFVKVLNAYRKKITVNDCFSALNFQEIKEVVCQRCSTFELAEMLAKSLRQDEGEDILTPITDSSVLNAMLKRIPVDLIISHTVANEEIIPSQVLLDIALQNNSLDDIVRTLYSQAPNRNADLFEKLWSPQLVVSHIENSKRESKQALLDIFKAISAKLSSQELLEAYHEAMKSKLLSTESVIKQEEI